MKKYIKYTSNNNEFFYDNQFEDYEKMYLFKYNDYYNELYTNVKYSKNIIFSSDVFITHSKPENLELSLFDVIGLFYPFKDNIGVYGKIKYITNNFITQQTFYDALEYATLDPIGIATLNGTTMVSYHLYSVYIEI
jgi:hypothetical protein